MKATPKFVIGQLHLLCLLILSGCLNDSHSTKEKSASTAEEFTYYSNTVKDTFYISVQLPLNYKESPKKRYPVVILTDANFYFPMLAPILHQYEKGGLLPPLILVGIGYKSFELMDSLRVRDYLYPKAIPSDEMKAPGGGQRYYQFMTQDLLPKIDSNYRTETNNRILIGHSFGGYFSLFALLEQVAEKRNDFKGFVSASPSLWYNNKYLFRLPQQLANASLSDTLNVFLSVGALETPKEWTLQPEENMAKQINDKQISKVKLSTVTYTDLDHMDAGLISFIRGIEKMYAAPTH
jgi:predicted alpha/beta superfamily hydrolase